MQNHPVSDILMVNDYFLSIINSFSFYDCLSAAAVNFICDHPAIKAISFVGSNQAGEYIYERGSKNGKRVQSNMVSVRATQDSCIQLSVKCPEGGSIGQQILMFFDPHCSSSLPAVQMR